MEVKQYRSIHAYVCVGGKSLNFNFVCKFELLKDTTLALLFAQSIEASLGRVSSHSMCKNRLYCPCLGCGLLWLFPLQHCSRYILYMLKRCILDVGESKRMLTFSSWVPQPPSSWSPRAGFRVPCCPPPLLCSPPPHPTPPRHKPPGKAWLRGVSLWPQGPACPLLLFPTGLPAL